VLGSNISFITGKKKPSVIHKGYVAENLLYMLQKLVLEIPQLSKT